MAAYRMTAARKAALRKAQAASARKRRGKGKGKLAKANRSATRNKRIAVAAVVSATGGLALAGAGVAGAYYAKKLASGGPKRKTVATPVMKQAYTRKRRAKDTVNWYARGTTGSTSRKIVVGSNGTAIVRKKRTRSRNYNRKINRELKSVLTQLQKP